MLDELWLPVQGYESKYLVSSLGNIKSIKQSNKRGYELSCGYLGFNCDKDGYFTVQLCNDGHISCKRVHRVVAAAFIPNPDNKPLVNHKNGIKIINSVSNLEWATDKENNMHARETGLMMPLNGASHPNKILSSNQVISIRDEYSKGDTSFRLLSEKYKVSATNIQSIVKKRTCKSI